MLFLGFGKSKSYQLDAWEVPPTGRCSIEVRGESQYQDALVKVLGKKPKKNVRVAKQAALIPEPKNEHDSNAVMVYVEGRLVGYLASEEAKRYAGCFQYCHENKRALACQATIYGGGKEKPSLGVWIDLPTPAKLMKHLV